MRLSGNAVLVTGGATGIGYEIAAQLAARGNRVLICGRRADKIEAALAAIPSLHGLTCDVADDADIRHLVDHVAREFGSLDMLINNAAVQVQADIAAGGLDFSDDDRELRTNLGAPLKLAKAFLPMLLARPESAIVNISSLIGLMPKANAPGYCASKAGLYVLSKSLRLRLAATSVKVFVVLPPFVDTPMTRGRGGNKMAPDVFVRDMLRQLEQDRFEIRVGRARTLMALHKVCPALAEWWTRRISAGTTTTDPEPAARVDP